MSVNLLMMVVSSSSWLSSTNTINLWMFWNLTKRSSFVAPLRSAADSSNSCVPFSSYQATHQHTPTHEHRQQHLCLVEVE